MQITEVTPLLADGGWAPYAYVKVATNAGITGYGECTDWRMPYALTGAVRDLGQALEGKNALDIPARMLEMQKLTEQSPGGISQRAIAGIELALIDVKGKAYQVPAYDLIGGKVRDRVRLYWSHCGTYRARWADFLGTPPLRTYDDIEALGREVVDRGYTALKTNILVPGDPPWTQITEVRESIKPTIERARTQLEAFKRGAGDYFDTALDINFWFTTQEAIRIAEGLEDLHMLWLEVDSFEPDSIRQITDSTSLTICSAESVNTYRDYKRFLDIRAMDVAMFDLPWAGMAESLAIAAQARVQELDVAPHNYYSHLATFMSGHLCATLPHLKIMETDVDACPLRELYVTEQPKIEDGYLVVSDAPGWGTDLDEAAVAANPWRGSKVGTWDDILKRKAR
ncbi:MAG: mandelate racemase/muconate lactonizing enzyme family protein [Chloroflexi bacterium]|nr:mandelate racemase/muconate lactonizing enzyme family protein [Chloroflexota bacterium]MYC48453.1 mandelate racemase/muconate lactonizing enzyme family protein [Chloroflexota bacterium]